MDIGSRIREIRKNNGQKLLNIAQVTGLSQPYISEIERGIKSPSVETLEKICSALGITLSEFFSSDPPVIAPELKRFLDAAEGLTPRQREAMILLMETIKDGE